MLVWACTENGRKQNFQKSIIYEFGNNKADRQTKKQMARWSEEGWKTSWWNRVDGKITQQRGMEEAPENGKETSHSAHDNERMNEWWV